MTDVALASALCDCLYNMHNTDLLKDKVDSCMLNVLSDGTNAVGLQMILSEFQNSRIKPIWMNSFEASHGISFLEFLKQSMEQIIA